MTDKLPVEKGLELSGGKYEIIKNFPRFDIWKDITFSIDYESNLVYLEYHAVYSEDNEDYEMYHKKQFLIVTEDDNKFIISPVNDNRIGSNHEEIISRTRRFSLD